MTELAKYTRANLNKGKVSYLVSEGFNDMTCRYIDISQTRWDKEQLPMNGGELILGGRQYVFPQYIQHYNSAVKRDDGVWVNHRQYVAIIGGICALNEGEDSSEAAQQEYIKFKKEIREKSAPGYPNNYKDTVGTSSSDSNLVVRSFTEGDSVTITFWAQKSAENAKITINPSQLGLSGNKASFDVSLTRGKTGFIIYNSKNNKVEYSSLGNTSVEPIPTDGSDTNATDPTAHSDIENTTMITTTTSAPAGNNQTSSDDSGEVTYKINWILITSVIAVVVLLVAFVIFVFLTEKPKPLYDVIKRVFKKK